MPDFRLTPAKALIIAVAITLVVAVPIYVGGWMAFVASAHQERFIQDVATTFDHPTVLAGTKLVASYYYKKDEHRVRVVFTVPNGYSYDDTWNVGYADAVAILPDWACRLNPLSDGTYASLTVASIGLFTQNDDDDTVDETVIELDNNPDSQGYFYLYSGASEQTLSGNTVYLGPNFNFNDLQAGCDSNYVDATNTCLDTYIGEFSFRLTAPKDITAWNAQFDKKAM